MSNHSHQHPHELLLHLNLASASIYDFHSTARTLSASIEISKLIEDHDLLQEYFLYSWPYWRI